MLYQPDYKYIPPAHFHILTPLYDFLCILLGLGKKFRKQILTKIPIKETDTVLDVGCGTGILLLMLKEKYPDLHVIGLDPDRKALEIAKKRLDKYSDIQLINTFAETIPLENNSIDIVLSVLTFHHLPERIKKKAIYEIYRILKTGGKLSIIDFGKIDNWLIRKLFFFEKRKYFTGNVQGLIIDYLKEAGFKNTIIIKDKLPLFICIIVAEK